jgi:hypothetical protein
MSLRPLQFGIEDLIGLKLPVLFADFPFPCERFDNCLYHLGNGFIVYGPVDTGEDFEVNFVRTVSWFPNLAVASYIFGTRKLGDGDPFQADFVLPPVEVLGGMELSVPGIEEFGRGLGRETSFSDMASLRTGALVLEGLDRYRAWYFERPPRKRVANLRFIGTRWSFPHGEFAV